MGSKKWTEEKISETVQILQKHTDYQTALDELDETKDSVYNAFGRHGLMSPTEYLSSTKEEVAQRAQMSTSEGVHTILVGSDMHIPFHHEAGCRNWLRFAKDLQPDNVVVNGDLLDCYTCSSFDQDPGKPDLKMELEIGSAFLNELRSNCPTAKIDFLEGNHEYRLKRVARQQKAFYNLQALTLPKLLHLKDMDIDYHDYRHPLDFNGKTLSIVHGHRVSKHSAYSAKAHLLDDGYDNVIIGHTHRLGSYYHEGHCRRRRAFEGGGLFDKHQADYIVTPNWQNGFTVVYLRPDMPEFIQVVPVEMADDGSFIWQGRLYKS